MDDVSELLSTPVPTDASSAVAGDEDAAEKIAPPFEVDDQFAIPDGWQESATLDEISRALVAVCYALNRVVTLGDASQILGVETGRIREAAQAASGQLAASGVMLQRHGTEMQLVTRPEAGWAVARALHPERRSRLSPAAMETVAIIAYRQPVTRAVIETIRGVDSDGVVTTLEQRGLIQEVGRVDVPGQPRLFGTTLHFLQALGLETIDQLPPLPGSSSAQSRDIPAATDPESSV